jgi:hypothetical protein
MKKWIGTVGLKDCCCEIEGSRRFRATADGEGRPICGGCRWMVVLRTCPGQKIQFICGRPESAGTISPFAVALNLRGYLSFTVCCTNCLTALLACSLLSTVEDDHDD